MSTVAAIEFASAWSFSHSLWWLSENFEMYFATYARRTPRSSLAMLMSWWHLSASKMSTK